MNQITIAPAQTEQVLSHGFLVMSRDILVMSQEWGLEVIQVIQSLQSPLLTNFMVFISAVGTEALYAPVVLFILWLVDERRGVRFGVLLIVSVWINVFLKDVFQQPRPINLDPSLVIASPLSYGAPSGHAQLAMIFWLPLAAWLSKTWSSRRNIIWAFAIFMVVLISFSRLYLGAHFPTDLLAGWIFAAVILFLFFVPGANIESLLIKGGIRAQNISAAAIALAMNGLFPQERALPALFLGFCLGYVIMKKRFPFCAQAEINGEKPGAKIMLSRFFAGAAGAAMIFLALRLILPGEESLFSSIPAWSADSPFYDIGRFLRYGALGFWASAGAPRMFQRMDIAQAPDIDNDF